MFLRIAGFLPDEAGDDSLKYRLRVSQEHEQAVMDILGWKSMAEESDGELELTTPQVKAISLATHEELPLAMEYFISVRI